MIKLSLLALFILTVSVLLFASERVAIKFHDGSRSQVVIHSVHIRPSSYEQFYQNNSIQRSPSATDLIKESLIMDECNICQGRD